MFIHRLVLATTLALVLLGAGSVAAITAPAGPRLAIRVGDGDAGSGPRLITVGPAGETLQTLVGGPRSGLLVVGDRPTWSADGSLVAFRATSLEENHVVAVVRADGSGSRVFPRTAPNPVISLEDDPVISPDGATVAFPRLKLVEVRPGSKNYLIKSAILLLDVKDGTVRRLTRWRVNTFLLPSSYSPDGSTLAGTSFSSRGLRAVEVDLRSRRISVLAPNAWEPTYSPDGSKVAFVRRNRFHPNAPEKPVPVQELLVAAADGSAPVPLLRRRAIVIWPSWDPSGNRLAFTLSPADERGDLAPEVGDKVMAINADGSCLTTVFSDPDLTLYGSAWQPGVGREAGPLSC